MNWTSFIFELLVQSQASLWQVATHPYFSHFSITSYIFKNMGGTIFFTNCTLLLPTLTLLCSFLMSCAMASVYTVGDQEEWNSQTNYATWAEGYNFSLGDVLVFKYVKGEHNVYEVTEGTFRSCDASSGVLAKHESGEDRVELNKVKRYWFICNIAGHCLGGMRFGIDVKDSTSSNNVNPATTNSTDGALTPHIEPAPADNSSISLISERLRVIWNFIPFGLLLFNLNFLI